MTTQEIRHKVKEIISNITNIDPQEIADDAHYMDDLSLDSLSMMEIGVDVDYEFRLNLPEDEMSELRTVADTVTLVEVRLAQRVQQAEVA